MVKICPKCGAIAEWDSYFGGTRCTRCDFIEKPKPSNADRIRVMTDEELAFLLESKCPSGYTLTDKCENGALNGNCKKCWLDWLRQEANNS